MYAVSAKAREHDAGTFMYWSCPAPSNDRASAAALHNRTERRRLQALLGGIPCEERLSCR
jgi:hypothetical protein